MPQKLTAAEAVKIINSGDRVFIHGVAAAPQTLIQAMADRAGELKDVEIVHLHTEGPAPYADPEYSESFRVNAFFVGANVRGAVNEGRADYIPVFLSEIPALFRKRVLPVNVALINVSPPDKHGFCSLGVSVDIARAAVECADHVIAQVNPRMPRTQGDSLVPYAELDSVVEIDEPLLEAAPPVLTAIDRAIGRNIAEMIEDGATLQMGIGSIPNAVLASLGDHRRLGIHTEMFSDGLI
ncbi:MAG: 4-hydroxybutyrate CoA-transferase, partial [Pyrinomonadaceae bacterium]